MPLIAGQLNGKYRRLLLPHGDLPAEAAELAPALKRLMRKHAHREIDDAAFAFWFVALFTESRVRFAQLNSHRRTGPVAQQIQWLKNEDIKMPEAGDALKNLQAFGMPGMIWQVLGDWVSGSVPLHLTTRAVSAAEMLAAQADKFRYVTIDTGAALTGATVCDTRDAFEFALHDLGHAWAFFLRDYEPDGQARFFRALQADLPRLAPLTAADAKFAADLEYCMADMNTHPEHLRQYLRGVIIEAYYRLRKSGNGAEYSEEAMAQLLGQVSCVNQVAEIPFRRSPLITNPPLHHSAR